MLPIAFLVTWTGYGITSWGYCLLRGWNIPASAWFSPINTWQWTASNSDSPPLIGPTQVNPGPAPKPVTPRAQAA